MRPGAKVRIQVPSATLSFSIKIPGLEIRPVLINHVIYFFLIFKSWIFIKHLFLSGSELSFSSWLWLTSSQSAPLPSWYPPLPLSISPTFSLPLFLGSWHSPTPLPQCPRESPMPTAWPGCKATPFSIFCSWKSYTLRIWGGGTGCFEDWCSF